MRKVVECDEQAVPKPDADKLNRAQKWCQLEVPVWEGLLRSLVTGVPTLAEPDAVLMLVDLHPDAGDLGLAALHYAGVCNIPIAVVMIAEGPVERDYLQSILHEAAIAAWTEGKLPKAEKPKLVEEGFKKETNLVWRGCCIMQSQNIYILAPTKGRVHPGWLVRYLAHM